MLPTDAGIHGLRSLTCTRAQASDCTQDTATHAATRRLSTAAGTHPPAHTLRGRRSWLARRAAVCQKSYSWHSETACTAPYCPSADVLHGCAFAMAHGAWPITLDAHSWPFCSTDDDDDVQTTGRARYSTSHPHLSHPLHSPRADTHSSTSTLPTVLLAHTTPTAHLSD